MKKVIIILILILVYSCSNSEPKFTINVGCENQISVNKKIIDIEELKNLIQHHHLEYKSDSNFKIIACKETSVKVLVDIRRIIKSVKNN